ncbi:MAG: c-type cytochrome [Sphingobacteriales bacterium]|jgi:mono/diheme cytochrome c family protein|nr:MAG: c-type cytochrome [Sphingobacteriales bacterium]
MLKNNIQKIYSFVVLIALFFSVNISLKAAVTVPDLKADDAAMMEKAKEGMDVFKANCTACHAVDRKVIGPALADVWSRWDTEENLIAWVKNSQSLIKSGHPYANKIFNDNAKSVMQAFPTLSDDQIKNIFIYVKGKQAGIDPGAPAGGAATTATGDTAGTTETKSNSNVILIGLFVLLLVLAVVLFNITNKLNRVVSESKGETVSETSFKPAIKKLTSIAIIIVVILLIFNIAKGAIDLGRSQGYAPEQPIRFSHALHVGQNKIECQYCHTGVEKSKHASIPGTQICMNCHKYVQEGPKYGKDEIKKIYAYSGWDPDEGKFVRAPKNIEWVKIHNLPDHVYFNHSQHVKVGKIECQTCHGKIEEMEVVEQFAPLSMGWCINCHRETKVQFADNNYYSVFEKYHDEIKKGKRADVTVEDIGGTECQKCHY